jgi:hypothetical protein
MEDEMKPVKGVTVNYRITVGKNNKATVSRKPWPPAPKSKKLREGLDSVSFSSNNKTTVIRYASSSPFAEISPGELIRLNTRKGPYKVVKQGNYHFQCGYEKLSNDPTSSAGFQRWPGKGGDTPGSPR